MQDKYNLTYLLPNLVGMAWYICHIFGCSKGDEMWELYFHWLARIIGALGWRNMFHCEYSAQHQRWYVYFRFLYFMMFLFTNRSLNIRFIYKYFWMVLQTTKVAVRKKKRRLCWHDILIHMDNLLLKFGIKKIKCAFAASANLIKSSISL